MLQNIPAGTHCLIDANIFYYHLVETPLLSAACSDFLERVEREEIVGHTAAVAVAEAIHKVMLAELVARYALPRQGLVHRLQRDRELIAGLTEHLKVPVLIKQLNIEVEAVTLPLLEQAATISTKHRLLTNDSLMVAVLEKLEIKNLVTNDDDFDSASGVVTWKPR